MDIKNEFGMDVAALVMAHTKNPDQTWEEVRKHKIAAMDDATFRVKLLVMADMTANLRSLWKDYRYCGEELCDGTCYALERATCEWHPAKLPEGLPVAERHLAERIEDNWRDQLGKYEYNWRN